MNNNSEDIRANTGCSLTGSGTAAQVRKGIGACLDPQAMFDFECGRLHQWVVEPCPTPSLSLYLSHHCLIICLLAANAMQT